MKKKIGIITFHNSFNYGALLQSYATQEFLEENGFESLFIDYSNKYENKGNKIINIRKNLSFKQNIIQNIKNILFGGYYYSKKSFSKFINELHKTIPITNDYDFDTFYAIISGSDQIWNPNIYGGKIDNTYLLDFAFNGKRISYASSIGSYIIDEHNEPIYKDALKKYNHISVREEHAATELKKIGINNIDIVCDPTFLLGRDFWNNIANRNHINLKSKKYILVYLMTKYENYEKQIKIIKDYYKMDVVFVTFSRIKRKHIDEYAMGYSPFEFLSLIKNAELVLTNSFHGTVFSLLFNKSFINLERPDNSKRSEALLNKLNLNDRILKNDDDVLDKISHMSKLNYNHINFMIEEYSNYSKTWLLNALKDGKE